jgi:hypothetical protein
MLLQARTKHVPLPHASPPMARRQLHPAAETWTHLCPFSDTCPRRPSRRHIDHHGIACPLIDPCPVSDNLRRGRDQSGPCRSWSVFHRGDGRSL